MFERGKLLLAIIVFTTVYTTVTTGTVKLLETVPGAKVDVDTGCREQAMELVRSKLLKRELNTSEEFQKAWKKGTACLSPINGGTKDHTAALSAFYNADPDFKNKLNIEVEAMGVDGSIYEDNFHYKSLYFLLIDSLTLLKPKECKTAYMLFDKKQKLPEIGSTVRFSSFIKADSELSNLEEPTDEIFLNITSCFYANLGENICEENIGEVLLSPSEYFTVQAITQDPDEYTKVTLKHSALSSNHNCFMFSTSAAVISTQSLLPLLMVSSLFSTFL